MWVFLFAFGCMLFGWPIVSIFENTLPFYLFLAWAVFICLIFALTSRPEGEDESG